MRKGYYYQVDGMEFIGFEYVAEDNNKDDYGYTGPFKTFVECKRDVQRRFRTDINYARCALHEIGQWKLGDLRGENE